MVCVLVEKLLEQLISLVKKSALKGTNGSSFQGIIFF